MKTCCGIHGPNYPAGCAAVCPAGECPREEEVRATVETATSSRFHMSESILLLIHYPSPFFFSKVEQFETFLEAVKDENLGGWCNESSCMCCSPVGSHYEVTPGAYCPAGFCDSDEEVRAIFRLYAT